MEVRMALQLRPNCEYCDKDLPPDALTARICSYECTFCADCAEKNCRMSARTVAAALRRDRSVQRQNGAQGFHLRSGRPQRSESTCPTVPMISQLTRHGLSTYRRKTVDVRYWHLADLGLSHRTCLVVTQSGREQHALWGRGPHASLSATPKKSSAREATT